MKKTLKNVVVLVIYSLIVISSIYAQGDSLVLNFQKEVVIFPTNTDGSSAGIKIPVVKMLHQANYFSCQLYSKKGPIKGEYVLEYSSIEKAIVIYTNQGIAFATTPYSFYANGEVVTSISIHPKSRPTK